MGKLILRAPQGSGRRVEDVEEIQVPDLWHLAMQLPTRQADMVLEVWHLAHDLLGTLRERPEYEVTPDDLLALVERGER